MRPPLLYSFRRCPYAIRARLALHRSGIPFDLVEVVLRDKPAAMLAISPKGTVPVLHLADGTVIEQSLDIMRWALQQHDPDGWLGNAPAEPMQALIDTNDGAFKQLLDRYKYPERHPEKTQAAWRDEAVAHVLAPLDQRLKQTPWLLGDKACLADMAIVPFIRQFAQVDRAWFDTDSGLVALNAWLNRIIGSDLFDAVMRKG